MHDPLQAVEPWLLLGRYAAEIATIVFVIVRIYRHPQLQAALPARFQWENLPAWVQQAIIWGVGAVGGTSIAVTHSMGLVDAAAAAISGILAAISAGHATRTSVARAITAIIVPPKNTNKDVQK